MPETPTPEAVEEVLEGVDPAKDGEKGAADKLVERAVKIIATVEDFKKPRLARVTRFRDLYAGKVPRKYRQPFNVVLPVFSGLMDTLMAEMNDEITIGMREQEPADYLKVKKVGGLWDMEYASTARTAKFPLKMRQDRSNALFSGRGFLKMSAESDPKYRSNFEIFELEDAIFQPTGGGHHENHLFFGQHNITRSEAQLKSSVYDQTQVAKLIAASAATQDFPLAEENLQAHIAKFKAMGLDVKNNLYIGEKQFRLAEMGITVGSKRFIIVFSPYYKIWVRFYEHSSEYPWVSWATHDDNKNFLSKAYADDMYGVADAIHTLFNQELTNREKQNLGAKAYDRDMFKDVTKLDEAQTRPDALVPADVGTTGKKLGEGIYSFTTPQLTGTLNIIDWMKAEMSRDIGTNDVSQGSSIAASKKATVALAEQQSISKRLLLRSSSYTEAMGEVARLFVLGLKEHMPARKAIRLLGADGEGWDEIVREDLELEGDVDVRLISSAIDTNKSQVRKRARLETLDSISKNPKESEQVNPKWIVEEKLRSGGEFSDAEISVAMDTRNYGNKDEVAYAYKAIEEIIANKKPELYYAATGLFLEIINDYANQHRASMGEKKYMQMLDYLLAHEEIAKENTARKARQDGMKQMMGDPNQEGGGMPTEIPAESVPVQ